MTNLNFKKQIATSLTILSLLVISPITTLAQEEATPTPTITPESTVPAECQVDISKMTNPEKLEARKKCNEALLAQDQEKLDTIRTNSNQSAIDLCRSDYSYDNPGNKPNGGGQYVPVNETGKLLNLTENTNKLTTNIVSYSGKSYEMFMKLCLYSHEIKRVEYAMENLTFVQEPNLQRLAASKIEEYKLGLLGPDGMVQTGYLPSGELADQTTEESTQPTGSLNKNTLYPENLESYLADANDEGYGVFMDNFSNYSTNIFKDEVGSQLQIDKNTSGISSLDSSISREEYNNFMDPEKNKELSSDDWWGTFLSIMDISKSNNPNTSYLNAQKELGRLTNQKVAVAQKEYETNGGFLPIRNCISRTLDGKYCRIWKTTTPGQLIQQSIKDAIATKLQQYLDPAFGKINGINNPTTNDIEDIIMDITNINFDDLIDKIVSIFNDNDNGGKNGGGGGGGSDTNPTEPPKVLIITKDTSSTRKIIWNSTKTSTCRAKNDWLGTIDSVDPDDNGDTTNSSQPIYTNDVATRPTEETNPTSIGPFNLASRIKSQLQNLDGTNGELEFALPLGFQFTWSHNGEDGTAPENTVTEIEENNLQYTWTIPKMADWLNSTDNDSFAIKIVDQLKSNRNSDGWTIEIGGEENPINPLNRAHIVKLFKKYETNNPSATVYKYYNFTYDSNDKNGNNPNIKIELKKPKYEISCTGNNGQNVTDSTN